MISALLRVYVHFYTRVEFEFQVVKKDLSGY